MAVRDIFVPQEDVMIRELTVEQTLLFAAHSRLDRSLSVNQIKHVVDSVIVDLNLHGVRHSVIGDENVRGISGGQRKRMVEYFSVSPPRYSLFPNSR